MTIDKHLFYDYTRKYPDDDNDNLVDTYLEAACERVIKHLGYDPQRTEFEGFRLRGDGTDSIALPSIIQTISRLEIDGENVDLENVEFHKNFVYVYDGYNRRTIGNGVPINVDFVGGYPENAIPKPIIVCVLQIASILSESSGGSLSVSSVQYAGDMGSRSFSDWRADKWLSQINDWKIYWREN